jgi:hypothetical protein
MPASNSSPQFGILIRDMEMCEVVSEESRQRLRSALV